MLSKKINVERKCVNKSTTNSAPPPRRKRQMANKFKKQRKISHTFGIFFDISFTVHYQSKNEQKKTSILHVQRTDFATFSSLRAKTENKMENRQTSRFYWNLSSEQQSLRYRSERMNFSSHGFLFRIK